MRWERDVFCRLTVGAGTGFKGLMLNLRLGAAMLFASWLAAGSWSACWAAGAALSASEAGLSCWPCVSEAGKLACDRLWSLGHIFKILDKLEEQYSSQTELFHVAFQPLSEGTEIEQAIGLLPIVNEWSSKTRLHNIIVFRFKNYTRPLNAIRT